MREISESRIRRLLHHLFSEMPLSPWDHRSPNLMAVVRFVMCPIVALLAVVLVVNGQWWGVFLAAPVAGLLWTGHVDLELARSSRSQ